MTQFILFDFRFFNFLDSYRFSLKNELCLVQKSLFATLSLFGFIKNECTLSTLEQKEKSPDLRVLSDRLVYTLKALNVTQAELTRRINVKPQAINYLCKSKTKKSRLTFDIADALGVSGEWLANGTGFMKPEDNPEHKLLSSQQRVPMISHEQTKLYCKKKPRSFENLSISTWLLSTAHVGKKGFAVELQDKSMYPRFEQGTIIVINPDKNPKDKEFALAYISSIDDIIFRQIDFNGENIFLTPINTAMYKRIMLDRNDHLIGALVETRWQIQMGD